MKNVIIQIIYIELYCKNEYTKLELKVDQILVMEGVQKLSKNVKWSQMNEDTRRGEMNRLRMDNGQENYYNHEMVIIIAIIHK